MRKLFFTVMLCGLLMFSAGAAAEETEYWITIDPIPDQVLGSTYLIAGETNLPVGSKLFFEHVWTDWECRDTQVCTPPPNSGVFSRILEVQKHTGDTNIWYTSVDTSRLGNENNFTARVYSIDTSARNTTTYDLIVPSPKSDTPWLYNSPINNVTSGVSAMFQGSTNLPVGHLLHAEIKHIESLYQDNPDVVHRTTHAGCSY